MSRYKTISEILQEIETKSQIPVSIPFSASVSHSGSSRRVAACKSELRQIVSVEKLECRALGHSVLREFVQASDLCKQILAIDPENEFAQDTLDFASSRVRDATAIYKEIAERADDPDLGRLRDLLNTARALCPNHPLDSGIGARVDERNRLFWRAMDEGFRYARRRETRNALDAFRRAYAINSGWEDLPGMIRELEDYVRRGKPVPPWW